jgi:hypothetical protein
MGALFHLAPQATGYLLGMGVILLRAHASP